MTDESNISFPLGTQLSNFRKTNSSFIHFTDSATSHAPSPLQSGWGVGPRVVSTRKIPVKQQQRPRHHLELVLKSIPRWRRTLALAAHKKSGLRQAAGSRRSRRAKLSKQQQQRTLDRKRSKHTSCASARSKGRAGGQYQNRQNPEEHSRPIGHARTRG